MVRDLPTGTVTFLFTDIEGSTVLLQQAGDRRYREIVATHDQLLRSTIAAHNGQVIDTQGDAFFAAFRSAHDAVNAAVAAQQETFRQTWPGDSAVRVRMGLHTGEPLSRGGGYVGLGVHRAARICAAAHGGQILLSQTTRDVVEPDLPPEVSLRDLGEHRLKGLHRPERVFQLLHPALPAHFPPLHAVRPPDQEGEPKDATLGPTLAGRLRRLKLVGRTDALGRLTARLPQPAGGSAGMVLVSGEPGIGKSRLLDEVVTVARSRGAEVLTGRCYERNTGMPYLPLTEALEGFARSTSPATWERLVRAAGAEIHLLLSDTVLKHIVFGAVLRPEMTSMLGAGSEVRPVRAVRNFLYELSRQSPVLLVVDDLHWADPPTLDLLHALALAAREMPVLILGAYREVELERTHPLSHMLVDLNRERLLVRERLGRLSRAETQEMLTELLGDVPGEGFATLLHDETEGNPFFIEELVNGLVEGRRLVWDADRGRYLLAPEVSLERLAGEIPQGIRAAIGARLDRLDPRTQEVLSLASVIGREFAFEVLARLGAAHGVSEEAVEEALVRAQAARFLSLTGDGDGAAATDVRGFTAGGAEISADYAFDHALIHQVVYGELDRRQRRRLQAEVGRLLEELYPGRQQLYAERLAYHYLESDDDVKALEFCRAAGDKMLRAYYDPDMALSYYLAALALIVGREPSIRHLRASAPGPLRRAPGYRFTQEEREALIAYLRDLLRVVRSTPAAGATAQLASRICMAAMHTGDVYTESIRLYEQTLLGADAEKLIVPTPRGNLVAILEFPGGAGPYPVVLMFHGSMGSKEILTDDAVVYRDRGLATLRVDLPGFGETTVPVTASAADAEILREVITAVLDHPRVDRGGVGVYGISLSPWHAAQLCARDSRVRAMVGISGMYNPLEDLPGVEIPEALFRAWAEARWKVGARPKPGPLTWQPDVSVYDVAHQIRCPMLLVYGALEPELYRVQSEKLATLVPTARTQVWRSGVHVLRNIPEAHTAAADWMKEQLLGAV